MKKLVGLGAVALALAGCGGAKVSVSSRVGTKTPMALTAASGTNQLQLNGGNITLTDVKIVVRSIRLEPTVAPAGSSSAGEDELGFGPFLVEFGQPYLDTAKGSLQQVFTATDVTAGTYKQIKFEVHKIEKADVLADPARFADMEGLSVRVQGTCVNCTCATPNTFDFKSSLDEEQEREGTFKIDGTNNIDLNVDPTNWFTDGGAPLDPCDTANQSKIESAIKASIDAFDDDNEDGKPDA